MIYGSVCSGIESASIAWEPLGLRPAWFSEIEPFPSAVLSHHWPNVANMGDMTKVAGMVRAGLLPAPNILVGGTPCQAFSIAGLRKGLDDARGQLTLTYVDILNAIDEQRGDGNEAVCVWENVPGVFSSKDNAFGCFLGALAGESCELQPAGRRWANAGCVFGPRRTVAWRVLDAQFFGLAQRRRRVFVVASARNGFDPRKVLFESEGVRRDTAPSRETEKNLTSYTKSGFGGYRQGSNGLSGALLAKGGDASGGSENLILDDSLQVRKLTPLECERLQGFPDNHTQIPWRGRAPENCPDGPRYKACGNSKAVPVIRFVGLRLISELIRCAV